jgi:peptide/nickel transport system substrate-binding protein
MASQDASEVDSELTRRHLLSIAVGGSTAAIAGCAGDGDGGDGNGDGGDGGAKWVTPKNDDEAFRFTAAHHDPITEFELNPWNSTASDDSTVYHAYLARYSTLINDYVNIDIADWEVDQENDEFRITLKDKLQWHSMDDGNIAPVTAEDMVFQERMERAMTPEGARSDHPLVTGFTTDGEKTFVAELNPDGYNEELVKNQLLAGYNLNHYRDGPLVPKFEELQDATTTDESDQIRSEVAEMSIKVRDDIFNGPWMLKSVNDQEGRFEINPEHWAYEEFNFKEHTINTFGDIGRRYPLVAQDKIDAIDELIPGDVENSPPHVKTTVAPDKRGRCLMLNYNTEQSQNDPIYNEPKVRQALAYALDGEQIRQNALNPHRFSQRGRITGLHERHAREEFGDDVYEQFPMYGPGAEIEKATQKMEEAGLSKENGQWMKPDGTALSYIHESFDWDRRRSQTLVQQLKDFGINAEHQAKDTNVLASAYWGSGNWSSAMIHYDNGPPNSGAIARHLEHGVSMVSPPEEFQVPPMSEFGNVDAEPTETIRPSDLIQKFRSTPETELTEKIKQLAWVFAYNLPGIPLMKGGINNMFNYFYFDFPQPVEVGQPGQVTSDNSHEVYGIDRAQYVLIHGVGGTQAREEKRQF